MVRRVQGGAEADGSDVVFTTGAKPRAQRSDLDQAGGRSFWATDGTLAGTDPWILPQRGRRLKLGGELDGRREEIEVSFGGADAEAAGMIQVEGADGGAAGGGEADDAGFLPGEVI